MAPPGLPPQITRTTPAKVVVHLTVEEVEREIAPGTRYTFWTFGGTVPGNLTLVDHALTRAFNKGAIGLMAISGAEQPEIYSKGIKQPLPGAIPPPKPKPIVDLANAGLARGKSVYERACAACHQPDGKGVPSVFPPVADSDVFQQRPYEMAHIVLHGRSGEIVVNGVHYNSVMPPQDLNDEDVAAVINYINVEMNKGKPVLTPNQVKDMRKVKAP